MLYIQHAALAAYDLRMTTIDEAPSDNRPDPYGVSADFANVRQTAVAMSALKPETLEAIAEIASVATRLSETTLQQFASSTALEAFAALSKATIPVPQLVLSESTRQAMVRAAAATASVGELSKKTADLSSAISKSYLPLQVTVSGVQEISTQLNKQLFSDRTIEMVVSALRNINATHRPQTAAPAAQKITKETAQGNSYDRSARRLIGNLGIVDEEELSSQEFTVDTTVSAEPYEILRKTVPEVADKIDEAANQTNTPFFKKKQVRYSLAALVFALIVVLHIVADPELKIIPQPWASVLRSTVDGGALAVPTARKIARMGDKKTDED